MNLAELDHFAKRWRERQRKGGYSDTIYELDHGSESHAVLTVQMLECAIAALRATEPAQVADADREATVDDINWPDDDGGERYLPESEVERLVAQGRAEAELAVAEADLTHAYLSGHAKGVVETEARAKAMQEGDSYAAWQQKRGMLADKVDWAILEYDEYMKDDAYDAQRVLDRIIKGLRTLRDSLAIRALDPAQIAGGQT